jgi:hypothetical protein
MDQTAQPQQGEAQESAVAYYNKNRKRSFLFSRITVIASMFILIIALGVNIYALNSQGQGTYKSNAATQENQTKILPKIPNGCRYQQIPGGLTVVCPSVAPTSAASPISVVLPQLPPQCSLETTASGSAVACSSPNVPIPTEPVTLPKTCTIANQPDTVSCRKNSNQIQSVPLPSLPKGCTYSLLGDNYYVSCLAK